MTILTLLGLDAAGLQPLTATARAHLDTVDHVVVPAREHPSVRQLPSHLSVESFDALYDEARWAALPQQLADTLLARASAGEAITLAVPGHPLIGNRIVQQLRASAREWETEVRIIGGSSIVEAVYQALDPEHVEAVQIVDALTLLADPGFPVAAAPEQRAWSEIQEIGPYTAPSLPFPLQPAQPALICHPDPRMLPALVERMLQRYPGMHAITVIYAEGETLQAQPISLDQLDAGSAGMIALYLAPLPVYDDVCDIQSLSWVTARLLGPAGCPWDREQTHASLRRYLIEEAHETLEALDAEDWDALGEELGDLLLQIVLHSEMGRQAGRFEFGDVTEHITQKLIRRHPHVFGDLAVSGSGEVLRNWEAIKAQEHAAKGKARSSLLDGVPTSLPALAAAQLLGEKAAKVGFDWPNIDGVWTKIYEELDEMRAADTDQRAEEFGDLLFVLARLASWLGVDGEAALRSANAKFRRRFAACERLANGRDLARMTPEELDVLWEAAKREERQGA